VTIDEGLALARRLMDLHGLGAWGLRLNKRKRTLGLCYFPIRPGLPGRIELSIYLILNNPEAEVVEVVKHEISHSLAGSHAGHGPAWVAMANRVGCRPTRCGVASMPPGNWRATCPSCKREYSRHRRPGQRVYWCLPCGRTRGTITFCKVP
jgi:predicted SprT family Zn-dependent metalloprotease